MRDRLAVENTSMAKLRRDLAKSSKHVAELKGYNDRLKVEKNELTNTVRARELENSVLTMELSLSAKVSDWRSM